MLKPEKHEMIRFKKKNGMSNSEIMKYFKITYAELREVLDKG